MWFILCTNTTNYTDQRSSDQDTFSHTCQYGLWHPVFVLSIYYNLGHAVGQLVEALCATSRKFASSIPVGSIRIFH